MRDPVLVVITFIDGTHFSQYADLPWFITQQDLMDWICDTAKVANRDPHSVLTIKTDGETGRPFVLDSFSFPF